MARPKGFAVWNPQAKTRDVLEQVNEVLDDYSDNLPLTVRQIFYRLVGQYGFDKTEQAYNRLTEYIVRARRSGMIRFDAIRDDGTINSVPLTYADVADFWRSTRSRAAHYQRNRLAGQPVRIELWCEAAGMVPQLRRVAFPYGVPVYSTGGFSSVTVTFEIAKRALEADRPTSFLHVGDYDPSGESIFEAMATDAARFVGQVVYSETQTQTLGDLMGLEQADIDRIEHAEGEEVPELIPERVALTAEQVELYNLPTAPPKATDTRSRTWIGETCQAEAMPPDTLAAVVREAIRDQLDLDRYDEEVERETADEQEIDEKLDELLGGDDE